MRLVAWQSLLNEVSVLDHRVQLQTFSADFKAGRKQEADDVLREVLTSNPSKAGPSQLQMVSSIRCRSVQKYLYVLFDSRRSPNGTSGQLLVCVDDNGRIVGWVYSKELVGDEDKAALD